MFSGRKVTFRQPPRSRELTMACEKRAEKPTHTKSYTMFASDTVLAINSSFTNKDHYFKTSLQEASEVFNAVLVDFGKNQKLDLYLPEVQNVYAKKYHPFF